MGKNNIGLVRDNCYGCSVCQIICPANIITNEVSPDGFIRPQILDQSKCIDCGLCLDICSYNNRSQIKFAQPLNANAVWTKNANDRYEASSGGVVPAIFENLIKQGYIINCVKFDSNSNRLIYYQPTTINELKDGKKSKYLQALFPADIDLKKDNVVIGTPCAIASLRRVLNKKKNHGKILLIDFFCHGVPSYRLWEKYLESIAIKSPVDAVWRDKQNGWHDSWRMIVTDASSTFAQYFTKGDLFYKFFLRNRCLRSACYDDCVFKCTNSSADIRVGDLWGSKYKDDEEGVSGVLAFTDFGNKTVHDLQDSCFIINESVQTVTESQMKICAPRPSSFRFVQKAFQKDLPLEYIDRRASIIELVHDIVPNKTKYYIKRIFTKLLRR